MKIAIDIDETLSNSHEQLLAYGQFYDTNILGNKGFKEILTYTETGLFNWTDKEFAEFWLEKGETIVNNATLKVLAKETVDKLKQDNHEIYVITARSKDLFKDPYEISKIWLDKNEIKYDTLIAGDNNKGQTCKDLGIEIIIDDRPKTCIDADKLGVRAFLFHNEYNKNVDISNTNITTVYSWGQVLYEINKYINR